jgi:5-methylcytosine-specific restriction enzyme subunit McrC
VSEIQIPIQNIYYLLCYAWDRLDQGQLVDVSNIDSTELVDLFATVLVKGIDHLARRGLDKGYSLKREELRGIRGRVDILSSARRLLLKHGRAACEFDELSPNTLPNQIIKATLKTLAHDPHINAANRKQVLGSVRALRDVDDIPLTSACFLRVQLHGNNKFYRFLLNICQLVHGSWLIDPTEGRYRFRDFFRNEKKMALVFQYFVFNFLRAERKDLQVFREDIRWNAISTDDPSCLLLPNMQTDISVVTPDRKLVIDTKYYQETLSTYYGSEKVHSANLFQLVSYLQNVKKEGEKTEGMLLYPMTGKPLDVQYNILGLPIRIRTINLAQPWRDIHKELFQIIDLPPQPFPTQVRSAANQIH